MEPAETSPRSLRAYTLALLLATFAAGGATGAGLHHWLGHRPPPPPPPLAAPLPLHDLGLTPEQHQKTRQILDRHRPRLEAILRETFPRARVVNEEIERDIRALLTPEQQQRLDILKAQRPPPPRPPPPGPPPPGAPPPPPFPPPEPPP